MSAKSIPDWVLAVLAVCGAVALYYNLSVPRSESISFTVDSAVRCEPVYSFMAGVLAMTFLVACHRWLDIQLRYVFAIFALGFILGHIFWRMG